MWQADEPVRILIAASFREKNGIPYALEARDVGGLLEQLRWLVAYPNRWECNGKHGETTY